MVRSAKVLSGLVLSFSVVTSGCASIVSKSVYPVTITSDPAGAAICVLNHKGQTIHEGQTPATIELKAGRGYFTQSDYSVKFSEHGYQETRVPIKQKVDGWYVFGNIFVGGLIGWLIVDPITGAMWTLEDVHVSLQPCSVGTQTKPAQSEPPLNQKLKASQPVKSESTSDVMESHSELELQGQVP